jgi:hypothetical protein
MPPVRRYGLGLLLLIAVLVVGKQQSRACVNEKDFILPQSDCLTSSCDTDCVSSSGGIAGSVRNGVPHRWPNAFKAVDTLLTNSEKAQPDSAPFLRLTINNWIQGGSLLYYWGISRQIQVAAGGA